ncbi:primosomal protein N' [Pigmentiphaga sp. NML080357]|uniref:primosomal protein N' n=1 Tax=Pigmentiphaga sp. NML080357 TaxID=2008675 RepID=UPI000B417D19|nr:primosomal protein N' [Pigmentiphaga sp. NML080357]OVZ55174.1 primosomal protein N' [Pigmentiphaga sp. NML080357]
MWVRVALDVPLPGLFDYRAPRAVVPGVRVIVPFGRRELVGIVMETPPAPAVDTGQVKEVVQILDDLPPLPADWLKLATFAADYYQRPVGEVMLPALPGPLRKPAAYQGKRAGGGPVARLDARAARSTKAKKKAANDESECLRSTPVEGALASMPPSSPPLPTLNPAQQEAVDALAALSGFKPVLLHGVTGSGKTEVYLRMAERVLGQGRQVMLLVPEINLTPQLENVFRRRLEAIAGKAGVAVLHSGLADGERLEAWLRAVRGQARVLLGTRLSLFTPLPELGLIVVDEEHDPSYKQQEGLRYSARDLAIWRARERGVPVVLGSATPSLETWHHAQSGRYLLLTLPQRALAAEPPRIRLLDTRNQRLKQGLAPQLVQAVAQRLEQGEQSLIFLNRRGYAPVLHCDACGWVSGCNRCSAYMVLHRQPPRVPGGPGRHELRCHHCGWQHRVPAACPDCGNQDLQPMGRGTQRLEEHLGELFPGARIARIDADSTRRKGSAQELFARMHAGEIDILVGTQMVAKGHDFQNLGFVGVLNADAMLFSHDFRAPERLFAQLMQVAGRAGRAGTPAEVYIQTGYPEQPLYQALVRHDYPGFARYALKEREAAGLPPFAYQALLTAEARELAQAQGFLAQARSLAEAPDTENGIDLSQAAELSRITLYDPVPLRVVRVANVERAQLLVESDSRPALQGFLRAWAAALPRLASASRVRWHLEVDPLEI